MENLEQCLDQLARLYVSYRQRYVLCLPEGKTITPRKKDKTYCKLTNNVLRNHLLRKYAVAVQAGDWGSNFICFDVDDGDGRTVSAIIDELSKLGVPREKIHISLSGGKGYHVELFFSEIVSTQRLKGLYLRVIQNRGLDPRKVEFRPTSGAAIKLPLSIHPKTGNTCWYVDRETLAPVEDTDYILGIEPIDPSEIAEALSISSTEHFHEQTEAVERRRVKTHVSPAVNSIGILLTEEGTRHNTMRNIAVYQRTHDVGMDDCRKILEDWYACQNPELIHSSPDYVQKDIEDIVSWVYSDRFRPPSSEKRNVATLSTSQMMIVLNQSPRSARRLTFLLLVRCRMREPQISASDASRIIGVSSKVIYEMLHRLTASGVITCRSGKRVQMEDQSFSAESNSYLVLHHSIQPNELRLDISMRELTSDFNRTYHRGLHAQIPQRTLREKLSDPEWTEYLSWAEVIDSDNGLPREKRIDLIGSAHELSLSPTGKLSCYKTGDRLLFPAYDVALVLGLPNPSVTGSQCPHKEMWHIEVPRCTLPNGKKSHQVICKNFIPTEDVLKLASRSGSANRDKITDWVASLETEVSG